LYRIYLHVFASNQAAIRTYEKAGFRREGLLRQHAHVDGKYVDVIVMGVLRDEFYAG
jgi:RimJ/RimL family protein N-acetyltransferase